MQGVQSSSNSSINSCSLHRIQTSEVPSGPEQTSCGVSFSQYLQWRSILVYKIRLVSWSSPSFSTLGELFQLARMTVNHPIIRGDYGRDQACRSCRRRGVARFRFGGPETNARLEGRWVRAMARAVSAERSSGEVTGGPIQPSATPSASMVLFQNPNPRATPTCQRQPRTRLFDRDQLIAIETWAGDHLTVE